MTEQKRAINFGFDRFSGFYLWALFIVIFGIWVPHLFLTTGTVHSLASEYAVAAMVGLAVIVPLAAGAYDLSVGATVNLSTILVAWLLTSQHWSMWPAIGMAILAAALIGVINGFVVVRLHVNSFIATLGMASIIAAVQTIVAGQSQPLPPTSSAWMGLTQHTVLGFQVVVLYLLIIALILWWALGHTPAGRYLYAVGGNPEASRLTGVKIGKWTWLSLITSATIGGVAGVLYCSLSGPSLTFGSTLLLPAFAAAFLGSTQFTPGRPNVWGTLLAVYVLGTGVQGLEYVTGVQWLNDIFNGVALIAAVAFAVWRQRKAAESRRASGLHKQGGPSGPAAQAATTGRDTAATG